MSLDPKLPNPIVAPLSSAPWEACDLWYPRLQYQRVFSNVHHILSSLLTSELPIDFERSGSIIYVDKMSGGSESDDCVTANGRVYIPEVRNEETPAVGMKFDSLDLVSIFEVQSGGMDKIGFIKKDIYNLECSVNGKLRNHDVELVTQYFMAEQKKNEAFYFKIEGDGHDRCNFQTGVRVLWRCCCIRYHIQHESIRLDICTNVGVNNHGQTIVLACAFLSKEMTEWIIWMFEEFKKAMPGGEPKTIITDQDAAMTRAISIAFPTTFHRLCIWHITSKFSVKLPHSAYKEYWREFQKAIWDTDNKDEFDAKWNIVVTKAAYARQFFAAGMSSSQRVEGSHDAFEVAQCILPMPMNKQMATLYTKTMFQKFEQELIQSTTCFLELKTEDASKVVFNVSERKNWETRVAEVVYVKDSDHASCSCKRFEFVGIICKHILALFRRDQIEYMPDKYILKRWKKTAKSGLVSDANGNEIKDSADPGLLIKRSTMSQLASDVVEDALMSEEGCELLSETLKSLQVKLKLLKDGPSNNEVGGSSSQTQYMKDPKRVRCKGRSKRVTGAKEKGMKQGIRHCRECGHIGHDRRQCPRNLNTPTSLSNSDESTPIDRSDPLFDEFDRMHGPTE
ncbi:hypothetical protein Prudu_200S000400 [Prunus dulcis]|uniref:Uncharacterized protein n=1 Tax=Prunus dulcis TaxID=3755 RepID=A0A5H2XUR7_PRUDU|nr:hypothetical protein Prudu_200S000400 [Prunus dulcis]